MARKILLADDSVTAQNMGRKILTDAGYEVVTVNNGSAALKKITECKPSLVVLDVYMPGYSGLEVCARIKEGRDTSGIPVLLTVGKLEPFRQEEARKAHADAFIVKPFEASELLAALSKLESKAGVQADQREADPPKHSAEAKGTRNVAPTMARYEREVADGAPKFGDQESGWKARLTMPSPGSRHEEPEPEPEIVSISASRPTDPPIPADVPSFEVRPVPSTGMEKSSSIDGLPSDVTPDELAAIAAAAAAIGGSGLHEIESRAPDAPSIRSEGEHATFASEAATRVVESARVLQSSSAGPVSAQVDAVFTSFAGPTAETPVDNKPQPLSAEPARASASSDSESSPAPVAPRWVAEEVPVEPAESTLILEREMQKAFAAFAAAESRASYEPGPVDKRDEPLFATAAPPAIGAPTPFSSTQAPAKGALETVTSAEAASTQNQPALATTAPVSTAKPPAPPFAPVSADEPGHAVVAFGEPHAFEADANTPTPAPPVQTESSPVAPIAPVSEVASASAAEQWHDLRQQPEAKPGQNGDSCDSFEDFRADQNTSAPGMENQIEAAMAAAASGDSSSSAAGDSSLSSIVDNMLAELKPKLMAELAKKLEKK